MQVTITGPKAQALACQAEIRMIIDSEMAGGFGMGPPGAPGMYGGGWGTNAQDRYPGQTTLS